MPQSDDPRNFFYNQRRDYREESACKKENPEKKPHSTEASTTDYEKRLSEMKKLAEKYQREGEGQLVKDILENVLEQKASGNLTNEQLVAFAKRISPLLNVEQRERLAGLVEQLLQL